MSICIRLSHLLVVPIAVVLAGCTAAGNLMQVVGDGLTDYSKSDDGFLAKAAGAAGGVYSGVGSAIGGTRDESRQKLDAPAQPASAPLAPKGQRTTALDGKWTAKIVLATGPPAAAAMVIRGSEGTWKLHRAPPDNPCLGNETPVAVEQTSNDSFLIKLLYSKLLANCIDGSFSARLENGVLKGQFGNGRQLELSREKEPQDQASLIGSWLVTVAGDVQTRTLIVSEEAPTATGALLGVKYGMTHLGQGPISAKMLRVGDQRQLVLVTQASSTIAATEQPDGKFKGTFTYRNGGIKEVTIVRISEAARQ